MEFYMMEEGRVKWKKEVRSGVGEGKKLCFREGLLVIGSDSGREGG